MKVQEPGQPDRQTTVITPLAHALRVNNEVTHEHL